ncbi:hypothetical protein [Jiella sonneratiae]|uniref:Uncharacterized protein n=1 Tax=Jiella sonneratiae TaxID=2816856 RepID=A0ABS3J8M5_9HYPH|nr:hypothetical protein [Jiella sonneratiae]MBO0905288.1 hypothetical protein [Jiella sonneratiae]
MRPSRRPALRPALRYALAGLSLLAAEGASAFSQFEGDSGKYSGSRDGILAVPLPPLPGTERERAGPYLPSDKPAGKARQQDDRHRGTPSGGTGGDVEGTDAGEVPISPEDEKESGGKSGRPAATPRPIEEGAPSAPVRYQADPPPPGRDGTGPRVGRPSLGDESAAGADAAAAVPLAAEIGHGEEKLPGPVREIRRKLMEVARSGDIERLRPLIETGDEGTVFSFADTPEDPIAFLKQISGDGQGIEPLAIMLDLLESGYARVEPDTPDEIYVWPYFTQVDITKLTKPQLVELFQIVTAGDYQSMTDFGAYNFYRIGITPDGKLQFFVAGD